MGRIAWNRHQIRIQEYHPDAVSAALVTRYPERGCPDSVDDVAHGVVTDGWPIRSSRSRRRWLLTRPARGFGMEHTAVPDVDANGDDRRTTLTGELGTTDLAINHYRLSPGESFSGIVHTHLDQEEAFFIVSGTATFEYRDEPDAESETVELGSGEAIRFAPGEYQTGRNETDEDVEAVGLGAPEGSEEVRVPGPCEECGANPLVFRFQDEGPSFVCPDCDAESDPE